MFTNAAYKSWWQIEEVVFGAPLLTAIALNFIMPLSSADFIFTSTLLVTGVILCVSGVIFIVTTRQVLSKYGQSTDPGLPTSFTLTTSVFSISRNSMYLGATCLLVGIALIFKLTWMFVLLILALIACHLILIKPEEQYSRCQVWQGIPEVCSFSFSVNWT